MRLRKRKKHQASSILSNHHPKETKTVTSVQKLKIIRIRIRIRIIIIRRRIHKIPSLVFVVLVT